MVMFELLGFILIVYWSARIILKILIAIWWRKTRRRRRGGGGFFGFRHFGALLYTRLWMRPKYRRMVKYIKSDGWANPNFTGTDIINTEAWISPIYKDNGYNASGEFTLYGAYQRSKGRDINNRPINGKASR